MSVGVATFFGDRAHRRFFRSRVCRETFRSWSREEIGVIGFDAARGGQIAVVGVHGNEKIGLCLIGKNGAIVERNVGIVLARVNHFGTKPRFEQLA